MLHRIKFSIFLILNVLSSCFATQLLSAWMQTQASGKGYGGITGGVQKIQYSTSYVYIYIASIPNYTIGPTWSNPNTPTDQKFWFQFPRTPSVPSTKTTVSLGHFGVWLSGVTIFNANDGQSYNSYGVWNRNAYYWEGVVAASFDSCNGHADSNYEYHCHVNPICQYTVSSTTHSPLLGFAFDGYPIYGPYAYTTATDKTSAIKRMVSGYTLRSITQRRTLANGTSLSSTYYGPDVSTSYPLGAYLEDYEYTGAGDLDVYNGRSGVTPDYSTSQYAYFVTIDSSGSPAYPYVIGPNYYGSPVMSNIGPSSGKTSPSETVTTYYSFSSAINLKSSFLFIAAASLISLVTLKL